MARGESLILPLGEGLETSLCGLEPLLDTWNQRLPSLSSESCSTSKMFALGLISKTHIKKAGRMKHTCNPSTGKAEPGSFLGLSDLEHYKVNSTPVRDAGSKREE